MILFIQCWCLNGTWIDTFERKKCVEGQQETKSSLGIVSPRNIFIRCQSYVPQHINQTNSITILLPFTWGGLEWSINTCVVIWSCRYQMCWYLYHVCTRFRYSSVIFLGLMQCFTKAATCTCDEDIVHLSTLCLVYKLQPTL